MSGIGKSIIGSVGYGLVLGLFAVGFALPRTSAAQELTVFPRENGTFDVIEGVVYIHEYGMTIRLTEQPSDNVTVTLTVTDNSDVTLSHDSLTFTRDNWNSFRIIKVTAAHDDDGLNDTANVYISASGGGYDHWSGNRTILVYDDDSVIFSPASLDIAEGGTASFEVKLSDSPGAGKETKVYLFINGAVGNIGIVRFEGTTGLYHAFRKILTFNSTNWNVNQTVTLFSEEEDADYQNNVHRISFSTRGYFHSPRSEMRVTAKDNDFALRLSTKSMNIIEGQTRTFDVSLYSQPSDDVRVTLTQPSNTDVTVDKTTLDFTSANWNTQQRVMVSVADDDDYSSESATISLLASSDGDYDGLSAEVRVDVKDISDGLVVSSSPGPGGSLLHTEEQPFIVSEGGWWTFRVKLKERPSADVTVTTQVMGSSDVTLEKSSKTFTTGTMTFTTENWNTEQWFRYNASEDDDALNDKAVFALSASGGGYDLVRANRDVVVLDNDVVIPSPTSLELTEGGAATIKVKLASWQGGDKEATVGMDTYLENSNPGAGFLWIAPRALTFTSTNWNVEQTVTMTAQEDSNYVDDDLEVSFALEYRIYDKTVSNKNIGTLTYSRSSFRYMPVTMKDNDRDLRLSKSTLDLTEGRKGIFDVNLSSQPTDDVRVTLTQPSNTDVTVDKTTLDFTSANWNTKQTVTVSVADDDDISSESATISLLASGGDYEGASAKVRVNVTDISDRFIIDSQPGVGIPLSQDEPFFVSESGWWTFRVRLKERPTADVTVTTQVMDNSDVTLETSSKIFTLENWNSPQWFRYEAGEDDDALNDTAVFALSASGGGYEPVRATRNIIVLDNDAVVFSPTSLDIAEGDATTIKVKLAHWQGTDKAKTVRISNTFDGYKPGTGFVTVYPERLTFTSTDWNTERTLTVTAQEDSNYSDDDVTIVFNLADQGYSPRYTDSYMPVTTRDNDRALRLSTKSLDLLEGGMGTFDVRLIAQPTDDVRVTLTQPSNADVTVDKTTLDFTSANWNTAQIVTVSVADDNDRWDEDATISLSASGGGYDGVRDTVRVTAKDKDDRLRVSRTDITIDEDSVGDDAGYLFVRLSAQPSVDVTVTVTQPTNTDVTVDKSSLTFTGTNWNVDQTLRISVADDDDFLDDSAAIVLGVSGGGGFNASSVTVNVSVMDNDAGTLTLPSTAVALNEGSTATFDVQLSGQPTANVTVTLAQPSNTDVKVDTDTNANDDQNTLTFTTSNWNSAQTVTVRAAADDDTDNEIANITVSASGGGYGDATGTVSVNVTDDDAGAALNLPLENVALTEGNTATFEVKLTEQPTANVTVTLAQPSNTDVKVDTDTGTTGEQNTLTFTTSNWNTAQTLTLSAAEDGDTDNETADISVSASGGGYDDASGTVRVALTDDDAGSLTLPSGDIALTEGSTATFEVRLSGQPTGTMTVTFVQPSNTDVKVDTDTNAIGEQSTLTFTTSNWNTAQTVTLSAAEDADTADETASITVSASGGGYGDATGSVSVALTDDDAGALTLSSSDVVLVEGSTATFKVRLSAQPTGSVTVTLAQPTNPNITVDKTSLTFTSDNWDTNQTVTLSATEDGDTDDETASIAVSASGGGYDDASGTVSIALTDDDAGRLILPSGDVALTEGDTATFQVRLSAQPTGSVTVTLVQPSNTDVRVDKTSLTFTTSDWNTGQTVTLSAAEDSDTDDETASVAVSVSGGGYGDATGTVSVALTDDDAGSLTLPSGDVALTEGGTSTFEVRLSAQPTGSVTVTLAQPSNTDVRVDKTSLTFTTSDWNTGQTVALSAAEDSDTDDETASVAVSASGGGYGDATGTVSVALTDDDAGSLTLPSGDIALTEGGTATFQVRLSAQPTGSVTVTLAQPSNTDVRVDKTSLTFTTSDWNTGQTVALSAAEDYDTADETASVAVSASGGGYGDATGTVSVDVTDDDAGHLILPLSAVVLTEGDTATFEVKLTAQPTGSVTVTLAQPSNTDVTVDKTSLTFTTSDWNTGQTVTLSAAEDDGTDNESAGISVSASGGSYDDATGTVSVALTDNDSGAALVLPTASVALTEGGTATFDMKLTEQPTGSVTVTLSQPGNTDVKVDTDPNATGEQNTLTFTRDNWNTTQTVTLSAAEDGDTDDETASVAVSASGGGYDDARGTVSVALTDDDAGFLTLPSDDIALTEGDTATFEVRLSAQPTANVTVALPQPSNTDVRVDKTSLTFTRDNWNSTQTVTLSAAEDDDTDDETASVAVSASGGGYGDASGTVSVALTDDDAGFLTLPSGDVALGEGSTATFEVKLTAQPTAVVTVTLTQPSNTDVTLDRTSLTFTTSDWSTGQTVALSAAEDDDTDDETASVAVSASGGGYGDATGTVSVALTDDDAGSLTLPSGDIALTEGSTATFQVRLSAQPTGSVTVTLAQPSNTDVKVDTDTNATGEQNTLTFTTSNWSTGQTVALSAAEDDDTDDETASVAVSASGGGYGDATGTVSVVLIDDDAGSLTLPSGDIALTEGGTATFDVRLSAQPTGSVTVTLAQPSNTDVKVDTDTNATGEQNTLTFTTSNWNTGQTVALSAAEDGDTDNETASVAVSASGGGYGDASGTVSVALTDDDAGSLTLPSGDIALTEGSTATFEVQLSAQPTGSVTVTLAQPNNTDVTLDKTSLTFTASDWSTGQTVALSAAEDGDTDNETASVAVSASGGGYDDASGTVSVALTDDDAGSLTLPSGDVALGEGSTATFQVRLSAQPTGSVTVTLAQPNNTDVTLDKTSLTFTTSDWSTGQTVALSAAEDGDTDDETASIAVSASGGGYDDASGTVSVALTDDDAGSLTLPSGDIALTEGGTATFQVRLSAQPTGSVTVTLAQPSNTDVKVDTDTSATGEQNTLTFTTSDWNTGQTVALSAAEDSDTDDETASVAVSASGGGYGDATGTVSVALTDDDAGSLTLPSGDIALTEGGTATFQVRLSAQPTGSVTVTLAQPSNTDVRVDKTSLTFTTSDWNTGQTVALSAAEDYDTGDETASVAVSASGGGYGDATGTVSVDVTDDDAGHLILPLSAVVLTEGDTATFEVKLTAQPTGSVTVTLAQPSNTDVRVDKTSLTFTTSNWNTGQIVTLSAAEDDGTDNESAGISVSASGGSYDDATGTVSVALTDNDSGAALVLPTASVALTEGGTATFDMKLTEQPTGSVTVTLAQPGNTDVKVDTDPNATGEQNTLTFTRDNWNTTQTVTLSAAEDSDTDDETASVAVSASGGGYDDARGTVSVALTDDDAGFLTLPSGDIALTEGSTATFEVQLSAQPTGTVTVTLAQPSNTDVTVDKTSLTFTTSDWNTAQTVTLSAAEDDDTDNETASVAVSASGGGYGDASGTVSVALTDDDAGSLILPSSDVSVNEDDSKTFEVRLSMQPTGSVTVTLAQPSNTDVKVDTDTSATGEQNTLTFTTSNWGTAQTVTVKAADDADAVDDSATISVTASGGGYDAVTGSVSVTVDDDDTVGLTVSTASLSVNEGSNATFTVRLATQPTGNVTVTVSQTGTANADVTASPASLTFTTSNWNTAQTVTVSGAADDDAVDDSASLSLSATGGGYDDITAGSVSVTVDDDDTAGLTVSTATLSVNEGSNATFTVRLATQPTGDVTVTVSQTGTANADVTAAPASLTFTTSNWGTAQTVTVSGAADADAVDDSATLSLSASGGGYDDIDPASVSVTVDDDDTAGLTVSTATLSVNEDSNATFTVKLATQPTGNVTVAVSQTGTANADVTAAPASLTFTTSNWGTAQTVTVSGATDDDAVDDVATLSLSAIGGGYDDVAAGSVSVTVDDDDTAGLTVSTASLSVNEGTTNTFTVKLATQPTGNVTVTVGQTGTANTDVTASPASLTFTTSNWGTAQDVTVSGAADDDAVDDSATLRVSATGGGYGDVAHKDVSVTVDDDDTAGLTVSTATLSVSEDSNAAFTVKLDTQPTGDVTVTVSQTGTANADVTAAPASLTFTASNWNTAQTVTVSGAADDDAVDDSATLQVSATGGGYDDVSAGSVSVTVDDDDTAGLTVSTATLSVNEGSNATFTVKLDTQPTGNVTMAVSQTGTANADVTAAPASLTFTTSNWGTVQTVTVSGADDDDAVDDSATLRVSATGGGYGDVAHKDVSVTVDDDDTAGLTVSTATLSVSEDSNAAFTVKLDTQPTGDVTVTVSQTGTANADVTAAPASLTFTTSNWGTAQDVTVSGAADADAVDDSATLRVSATGGGYGDVAHKDVSVTVNDDDTAGLTVSTATLSVNEGSNATFTVRLATQPTGDVTVAVSQTGTANADVTVDTDTSNGGNQDTLTFTTSNWNTVQTVTVSGAADDDAVDDSATLRVSASGGGYGSVAHKDVSVTVNDDDTAGLTVSTATLSVNEGSNATFTVRLATQPTGDVTVTVSQTGTANADVTAAPASLTFTTANWNTAQTVTVSGAADDDAVDDSATLSLSASGGGYDDVSAASVSVTVDDDDTAGLTVSTATLSVNEDSNATFTVKLATQPTGNVTVTVGQTGTANADVTASPASLTFTTANWGTAQDVTVSGAADDDAVDDSATLRVNATGGGYGDVAHKDVSVTVDDDDTAGLTVSTATLSVNEGSNATFTVKLDTRPTGDVTVAVGQTGTANADVTAAPASLTFTTANWNTVQTVTVSGAADDDAVDDSATLSLSATGGGYGDVSAGSVSVTVDDDDTAGLTVSTATLSVNEDSNATFTVKLDTQPTGNVTVAVGQTGTANTDVTAAPASLTFTTANWNTVQTVTVSGADDDDAVDDSATLSLSASGGGYDDIDPASVSVTVDDDDEAGLTVSTANSSVNEGSNATFTVKLDTQPTGDVTVTVSQTGTANADVTAAPASLTFTASNWNTAQTVTVSGAADDDAVDDSATLSLSASGGGYDDVAAGSVSVTVDDDDTAGFVLPSDDVSVDEDGSETFEVSLSTQPTGSVTVTLAQPTNTDVTIDTDTGTPDNQNTLTFTTSNWGTAQTVTVSGADDDDAVDDSATISVTASGGGYGSVTGSVDVKVDDADDAGFVLPSNDVSVNEDDSETFEVSLSTQPTGSVTVTLAQPTNTDVTVDTDTDTPDNQNTLIFTTSNWGTAQTVTVSGADDDDAVDDSATLSLSATGGGYDDVAADSVSVTVEDDDTAGLTLSTATLSVNEGSNATFTVVLDTQPTGNVTVTVSQTGTANTDVTAAPASLTFTTSNWDDEQTVTVSGADDDDTVDDSATLSLSASGGGYDDIDAGSVTVTVDDDDTAGFDLPSGDIALAEGAAATFEVRLSAQPTADVTVILTQPSNTDVKVDTATDESGEQNTLTFTSDNWGTNQTVTLSAAEDDDTDDETASVAVSASGGGYDDASGTVSVALTDDDAGSLTLPSSEVALAEGGTATFEVRLSTQPTGSVTVTLAQPTNTDVKVDTDTDETGDQNTLTFTTSNWTSAQTVTVRAAADDDIDNETASVSFSAVGGGYDDATGTVSIALTDDDSGSLTLPSNDVTITEGGTATFEVRLSARPTANVVVTFTQPTNTDVKVDTNIAANGDQTTLTFTTSDWNTAQTVMVRASEDDDTGDETASVAVSASGGGYDNTTGTVSVALTDNDAGSLILPSSAVALTEGSTATFEVRLSAQPSGNVTVTLAQPDNADVNLDTDTGAGGDQNTLVFTTSDWNRGRTVTVRAAEDGDILSESARISVSASGGGYGNATGAVSVALTDNDAGSLTLPSAAVSVTEGDTGTFTVSLGARPSADVTVVLTQPGNTDVTVDKTRLIFTVGDWNTGRTVTVRASQDPDASNESASIAVSATGGGYDGRSGRVSVAVTDDDEEALTLASDDLGVTEGESATFDVKLATLPSANVSVTLTLPSDAAVTLDKSLLTFTGGNWNTAQRVTVSAGEDDDLEPGSASIALSASGGGYDDVSDSLSVRIADNDAADLTVSPTAFNLVEGGQSTFTVRLTQQPADDVSVSVGVPSDSDVRVDKTALTFTSDNWDTEQSVEASAGHDADAWDDGTSVITIAASGGGYDDVSESVSVDVSDDDEESLVLPPNALKVAEGKSGRFTVSLATLPSAAVSVTLTQPSNADVRVDADLEANGEQTQLTFTAANWNTPRTVTVIVGDDDDASNESASIALSATGGGYDGEVGSVDVDVEDDDTESMVVAPNPLNIVEGESGTFSVSLATQPSGDVRVLVAERSGHNADISFDKDSLVFTETNWKEGQTITVSAGQDDDTARDETTITLSASGGGYDDVSDDLSVEIADDDEAGLVVSPEIFQIVEGTVATFTVRLAKRPSEDVTVSLIRPPDTEVRIDKTTLVFTVGTWNTEQAVTVSAGQDADNINDEASIAYSASGDDYEGIRGSVTVEVIDDDFLTSLPGGEQGEIIVDPGTLELEEGSTQTLRVRFYGIAPTSNVTLVLTKVNPDIALLPESLTFTPSNWNVDQAITVSAADDVDGIDDDDTITLAAIGIDVPSRTVSVSVKDDDEPAAPPPASAQGTIVVSPGTLVLGEGMSGTFTARLDGGAPDAEVSVSLSKTNDDVTISPQSLTFDSSNWDSDQVITVTLGVDADAVDDTDTITLSAVGGGYDGAMRSLVVAGIDNPGTMAVTPDRIALTEGGDPVFFAVRLGTRPVGTPVVIVSLSSSNPGIELIPPSLIFTGDDWDTSQSVSAKAVANSNRQGGLDIITLAATGGNYSSVQRTISVSYTEDGSQGRVPPATLSDPVRAQALAMPPPVSGDRFTLFIHCKQDVACTVFLDCSAQSDGSLFQGAIPVEMPARGTRRLTAKDIETYTGGSWSGKGRLGCALRSAGRIDSQVWTRSGDGVLVNNSAYIRSHPEGQVYRADIESITSPDGFERSNIRVRCTASGGESCTSTRFSCYADDGTRYESDAFEIGASTVRHLQSEELAEMIGHRWRGMGLSCELRSDAPFTVQILTRTGGGGALVNNSGGGRARIGLSGG